MKTDKRKRKQIPLEKLSITKLTNSKSIMGGTDNNNGDDGTEDRMTFKTY